jgi:hypothetical protein
MNKNSHRPKGVAIAVLGMSASAIEGLHVGKGVPVGYPDDVQVAVVAAGAPRPILFGNQVQRGHPRRVDQVSDVAWQFAEEKGSLDPLHCGRLQGGEVVPHDGVPVAAVPWVVQPFTRPLGGTEAVGVQQNVLHLLVRVTVGRGAFAQRANAVDQRKWELRQRPAEFCEQRWDNTSGENRIDVAEPRLGQVGVVVG